MKDHKLRKALADGKVIYHDDCFHDPVTTVRFDQLFSRAEHAEHLVIKLAEALGYEWVEEAKWRKKKSNVLDDVELPKGWVKK